MSLPTPGLVAGNEYQRLAKQSLDTVIAGNKPYREITGDYTVDATDYLILADATDNTITVTLPPAESWAGFPLAVKKVDSSANAVTIDGSETIDGAATYALANEHDTVSLFCDGEAWQVVGTNPAFMQSDPGADRIIFWDDSAGKWAHLTLGTGLSISGTTLNAATGTSNTVAKAANETVTADATLSSDAELTATLAAGTWRVRGNVLFATTAGADFKWGTAFSGTATVTGWWGSSMAANATAETLQVGSTNAHLSGTAVGAATGGGRVAFEMTLVVTVSGDFSFQWAQNTSDAGNTTVTAGSTLEYIQAA